jgi:hypothetical protein
MSIKNILEKLNCLESLSVIEIVFNQKNLTNDLLTFLYFFLTLFQGKLKVLFFNRKANIFNLFLFYL